MKGVQFGRALEYTSGVNTSVAINRHMVLEMHKSEAKNRIWYRLGRATDSIVQWEGGVDYDNGIAPACAVNNNDIAVEIHRTDKSGAEDIWYTAGRIGTKMVDWKRPNTRIDSGVHPRIAINDQNVVVEVHQWSATRKEIVYRVGRVNPANLDTAWGKPQVYDKGVTPDIAINSRGVAVEVHQSDGAQMLFYRIGDLQGDAIRWRSGAKSYSSGIQPSIAVTDDGFVIEVHRSEAQNTLWCRDGVLTDSDSIDWTYTAAGALFDEGHSPSVACSGNLAIQTHQSQNHDTLWYSTSRILDRSRWMADRLALIGSKPLKAITLPGSHNAAMYDPSDDGSWSWIGYPTGDRDQDLTIYEQLVQGVRFFDLRPKWTNGNIYLHHGNTTGPLFTSVLSDIQRFMKEGNRELLILTLTHYEGFDNNAQFETLTEQIQRYLTPWTYKRPPNEARRLAEIPMSEYLASNGAILVASDGDYYYDNRKPGIYVYRTANSTDPATGDLIFYENYANTDSYEAMKKDQITKFENYAGKCNDGVTDCDLFLMWWTLTAKGSAFPGAMEADSKLGLAMSEVDNPNSHGCALNVVCLDFTQAARPVDVCLSLFESSEQPVISSSQPLLQEVEGNAPDQLGHKLVLTTS